MDRDSTYCTEEQTKKALEAGAPIERKWDYYSEKPMENECYLGDHGFAKIPTVEWMMEWLKHANGMKVQVYQYSGGFGCLLITGDEIFNERPYRSKDDALLATIDAALDYLLKSKEDKTYY